MNLQIILLTLQLLIFSFKNSSCKSMSYTDARKYALAAEELLQAGSHLHLNEDEQKVDNMFMNIKLAELAQEAINLTINPTAMHFFKVKPFIEKSQVFKFLRHMPKGANLHLHSQASVSSGWVVRNISYTPGLLRCTNEQGLNILSFRRFPSKHGCRTKYVSISEERQRSNNISVYDYYFEKLINLWVPTPEYKYPTVNSVWHNFQNMFRTMSDVWKYLPVFRAYMTQMMEELYEDNIMYAEIRTGLNELYDKSGRTFPVEYTVQEFKNIVRDFRKLHPNFEGVKIIFTAGRYSDNEEIRKDIAIFKKLYKLYPDIMIGFDLVGHEDKGRPLHDLLDVVSQLPPKTPLFLHAGETHSYGADTDNNLLDAVLLNTKRIGHGYALMKHPVIYGAVKRRNIAVEVCPISNQVLNLVSDLHNHPASLFVAHNITFVICSDDPGFWNAKGLSYDFYYAIMSIAPNNAGLKLLKSLVWNSIEHSTFNAVKKREVFAKLQHDWNHFIAKVLDRNII